MTVEMNKDWKFTNLDNRISGAINKYEKLIQQEVYISEINKLEKQRNKEITDFIMEAVSVMVT